MPRRTEGGTRCGRAAIPVPGLTRRAVGPAGGKVIPRAALVLALMAVLGALAACTATPAADQVAAGPKPKVIVTTPVLGDVVRNALGDQAEVEVLVPPGVDTRTHVVSDEQRARIPDASVVVVNGLGVDPELGTTLLAVRARGHEVIEAASRLNPLPLPVYDFESPEAAPEGSAPTTATTSPPAAGSPLGTTAPSGAALLDSHVWLDPDRMTQLAHIVGDAVGPLPGVDRAEISRRIDAYAVELAKADEAIQAALLPLPEDRRALVTDRNQLGYFAERYGLDVVSSLPRDWTSLSPAQRAVVVTKINDASARVILTSMDPPAPVVTEIAGKTRAPRIVTLDVSTLGPPGSGTDTVVKLLTVLGNDLGQALRG